MARVEWLDRLIPASWREKRTTTPDLGDRHEPQLELPRSSGEATAATVVDNPILYHDGLYTSHLKLVIRVLLTALGMTGGAFLGAVIWNISLYPLKEKITEYIVFGEGQYMHVGKGKLSADTVSLLIEEDLKKYVEFRETIDHTTEGRRFAWVKAHTLTEWFKPWAEYMSPGNQKSPLEIYRREEKSRAVYVNTLVKTSTPHEYQIEATFMDRRFGNEVGRSNWVIVLRAKREEIDGASELARLNPLGLMVSNYDARTRTVQDADKAKGSK